MFEKIYSDVSNELLRNNITDTNIVVSMYRNKIVDMVTIVKFLLFTIYQTFFTYFDNCLVIYCFIFFDKFDNSLYF